MTKSIQEQYLNSLGKHGIAKCAPKVEVWHVEADSSPLHMEPLPKGTTKSDENHFLEFEHEIYEWLSLVRLESPRINTSDHVDPYLSRYRLTNSPAKRQNIVKVRYDGMTTATRSVSFLRDVMSLCPADSWVCFCVTNFRGETAVGSNEFTFLRLPGTEDNCMTWQVITKY